MRDVVGDLLEAVHQRLDPLEHDVEVVGQPIELVAGARDRQAPGQVAVHDPARRFGHRVDALEHATGDEEAAGDTQHDDDRRATSGRREDDVVQPLALLEIAADQQTEAARQLKHAHQGVMLGVASRLVEAAVGGLGPARPVENAGRQRADIAGERPRPPGWSRDRGSTPAGATRASTMKTSRRMPPWPVLLGKAGDLGVDRLR